MSARNDGGPAFPSHGSMGEVAQEGMSLRDYFAAKAIGDILSNQDRDSSISEDAALAYRYADAMLKARQP